MSGIETICQLIRKLTGKSTKNEQNMSKNDNTHQLEALFFPDQPLSEEPLYGQKTFGFEEHINQYIHELPYLKGPFIMGVLGPWGCGKSTYCSILARKLEKEEKQLVLNFNAWRYEHDQYPIVPLLSELANDGKIKEHLPEVIEGFKALLSGFTAKVSIGNQMTGKLGIDFNAGKVLDKMDQAKNQTLHGKLESVWDQGGAFSRQLDKLHVLLADKNIRIFIFIDDLDRCTPEGAVNLLEQIKLVLDLPCCVFVLALNQKVLDGFIRKRYRDDFDIKSFSIDLYIDKLIQLKVPVPKARNTLSPFVSKIMESVSQQAKERLDKNPFSLWEHHQGNLTKLILLGASGNPRAAIRLINELNHMIMTGDNQTAVFEEAIRRTIQAMSPDFYQELEQHKHSRDYLHSLIDAEDKTRLEDYIEIFVPESRVAAIRDVCLLESTEIDRGSWLDDLEGAR